MWSIYRSNFAEKENKEMMPRPKDKPKGGKGGKGGKCK